MVKQQGKQYRKWWQNDTESEETNTKYTKAQKTHWHEAQVEQARVGKTITMVGKQTEEEMKQKKDTMDGMKSSMLD